MIKYKLVEQDMTTYQKKALWKIGEQKEIKNVKNKPQLCTADVFHFYDSPEMAVLFNPIHATILNPRLFKVNCNEVVHDGLKGGATKMKLLKELPLPVFTLNQRVYFGILCAREVYNSKKWLLWADNWIKNIDRSSTAAAGTATGAVHIAATRAAAGAAAYAAAYAAADAAAYAAVYAARTAANAAYAAANAAAYATNIDVINRFRHQLKTIIKKVKAFKG